MPFVSSARESYGAQSRGNGNVSNYVIDISPSVNSRTRYNLSAEKLSISTNGEYKVTVLTQNRGGALFRAKCWGAGGYGGDRGGWTTGHTAGGGGYAEAVINYPLSFTIIVGQAGFAQNVVNSVTIGGGHTSNPPNGGQGDMRYAAGGGGFSGLLTGLNTVHTTSNGSSNNYQLLATQSRSIIIAGGGGGGGVWSGNNSNDCRGGAGGGGDGQGGILAGSQAAQSAGRISTNSVGTWGGQGIWNPTLSDSLNSFGIPQRMCAGPGEGNTYGAGGGGGYWAGSCSGTNIGGNGHMGGGGGGSGYVHPTFCVSGILQQQGSFQTPPQQGNIDYVSGRAVGGSATSVGSGGNYAGGGVGTDGLVVLGPV